MTKLTFREYYLCVVVVPIFMTALLSSYGMVSIGIITQALIGGISLINFDRWCNAK